MWTQGKLTPHRNPRGGSSSQGSLAWFCFWVTVLAGAGAVEGCRGMGPPQKAAGGGQPTGVLPPSSSRTY